MDLPTLQIDNISFLFGTMIVTLSVFWGINKAIIISKSN